MSMSDTREQRVWKEQRTTEANSDRQVNLLVAVCVSYTCLIWKWQTPEGWLLKCHVHGSSRPFVLFHFLLSYTFCFISLFSPPYTHTLLELYKKQINIWAASLIQKCWHLPWNCLNFVKTNQDRLLVSDDLSPLLLSESTKPKQYLSSKCLYYCVLAGGLDFTGTLQRKHLRTLKASPQI